MQKGWTERIALVVGLLSALAWYAVFGYGIFVHGHKPRNIHWDHVAIGAVISFIVGWGLIRLAARVPRERPKEEDDIW
jgi:hypothetical protein